MDRIEPPTWGETLDRWFARLDTEKFRTGVRERLLAQALLSRLAASGELPATPKEMLALAAPLLCTTREQQRRYAIVLDDFVAAGERGQAPHGGRDDGRGGTNDDARRSRFELTPQRLGALIVALVVVVAAAVWWANRPAPVQKTTTKDSGASQLDPDASRPAVAAPVRAFYVPPLPLPLQPPLPPSWSGPLRVSLFALGALALAALLWAGWALQRRQMALQGVRAGDDVEHHLLSDVAPVDVAPHPMLTRAVARALRQRVAGEARVMDIGATLQATAAARGAFSPRWRELRRTPEYLVLIDTRAAADHHAGYALTLVNALKAAGVSVQIHRYDTTPASGCWASGAVGNDDLATRQKVPLALLATRSAHQRLLVFGPADALLNAVTGEPQPWLASLRVLAERAWFTPQPIHAWGAAEQAADEAGFLVLPLQEAALPTLAGWLTSERLTLALDLDSPQTFPALLRGSALDWVTRADAPPPDALESLVEQLRAMLGGQRFQWLCACAVFPALTPPLTLALGRRVLAGSSDSDPGAPAANPRALALGLASLSALPWFRYGRMPAWLRRELLQRLAPDLRQQLDDEVRGRLDAALTGGDGPLLADIATRRRRLTAALQRRHGPLRDVVLADFIRRGADDGLAQRLPEALRRRLFKDGDPGAGWRPAMLVAQGVVIVAALFALTPLWQAAVGTTPQPALARMSGDALLLGALAPPQPDLAFVSVGETVIGLRAGGHTIPTTFATDPASALVSLATDDPAFALAEPMPQRGADGVRIDLSSSRLQLRDAAGAPVGRPLDTGGLAPRVAAFSASGSRVVAMLSDGSLRSWGRPWAPLRVDVVGCAGEDPGAGAAGSATRAIADSKMVLGERVEATAYTEAAWLALPDRSGAPLGRSIGALPAGRIAFGTGAAELLNRVPVELRGEILPLPASAWSTKQEPALPPNRIAIGACLSVDVFDPADAPAAIEGLGAGEQAELLKRVDLMFDIDADKRKAATASLMTDAEHYSDAVPLAIWRAMRAQGSRGQTTQASMSGVINVLVLLQSASPTALNRERAAIEKLVEAVRGNGPQTQEQIARLQKRLDAAVYAKPLISTQIAGEAQRALAQSVDRSLSSRNLPVEGIEVIGERAPSEPQLRVQGASDRLTARRLRAALQQLLQAQVGMVDVKSTGDHDTYEIWIDRAACTARQVTGCAIAAASTAAQLPGAASALPAPAQTIAAAPPSPAQTAASAPAAAGNSLSTSPVVLSYAPTPRGLDLITRFEGFQAQAAGGGSFQTIGYGHALTAEEIKTGEIDLRGESVAWKKGLTQTQARRLLLIDLQLSAAAVDKLVTVYLTPNQRDALVSFVYSVGPAALRVSTLLTRLNSGDYGSVPEELLRWRNVAGAINPSLQARRQAEADLWNTPVSAKK